MDGTKHTTTETLLFQLTQKNNEMSALKENMELIQSKRKQELHSITYEKEQITEQLALAHRQLGDMAEQVRQLREDTATSKAIHAKKAQVAECRITKNAQAQVKVLELKMLSSKTQYDNTIQDIQEHWNGARHQLAFERELVATQRAKIISLEQTLEQSQRIVDAERSDYEKKCESLTHIHNEQRDSLEAIQSQFAQCRQLVDVEQHRNVDNLRRLEVLENKLGEKDETLKKERMSKNYMKASVEELQQQLEEEVELRAFAQQQWDDESENHRATEQKLQQCQEIEVQLRRDVSDLMTEMKEEKKSHLTELETELMKMKRTTLDKCNRSMQDDIVNVSLTLANEWKEKMQKAVAEARAVMFDLQQEAAKAEIQQREDNIEEMRTNHMVELQLVDDTHRSAMDSLNCNQSDALDALKSQMDIEYRQESEARLEDASDEYELRLRLALEHQFTQLNKRHVEDMKMFKTEMEKERAELLEHVRHNTSMQQAQIELEERETALTLAVEAAVEATSSELKVTYERHLQAYQIEKDKTLSRLQKEINRLRPMEKALHQAENQIQSLATEYEAKYQDAFAEVQHAMSTSEVTVREEEKKRREQMQEEIDQLRSNTTSILQSKLEIMATKLEEQHAHDMERVKQSYAAEVSSSMTENNILQRQHKDAMQLMKTEHCTEMKQIMQKHEKIMAKKNEHALKLTKEYKTKIQQIEQLTRDTTRKEAAAIQQEIEKKYETARSKLDTVQKQCDHLKSSSVEQLKKLEKEWSEAMDTESKLTSKLESSENINELLEAQLEAMAMDHTHLIRSMEQKYALSTEQLGAERVQMEKEAKSCMDKAISKNQTQMDQVVGLHQKQIYALESKHVDAWEISQKRIEELETLVEKQNREHVHNMNMAEKRRSEALEASQLILEETLAPLHVELRSVQEERLAHITTIASFDAKEREKEIAHVKVLEAISRQMTQQQSTSSEIKKKHKQEISLLRQDLCDAQESHRLSIAVLEQQHAEMMKDASLRIRKATESTLEFEAAVREEMLEEHQRSLDELEKQVKVGKEQACKVYERNAELEKLVAKQEVNVAGYRPEAMREELRRAEQRLSELKDSLNAHLQLDQENATMMNAAVAVVGNHNMKEKIHFVEKLQNDRRELKHQNRQLTAEVASLKIEQATSGFKKFHETLNMLSPSSPSHSSSSLSSSSSSSLLSSSGRSKIIKKLRSSPKKKSPAALRVVVGNKENAGVNSPRSARRKKIRSQMTSAMNSPRSIV